ncbi:hypothetical protein GQ457_12G013370 [Hibiscus cannabinus]
MLCLDLLEGRVNWSDVNRTVIVLIPKLDKPSLMRQFRPISLCNVTYKTCSKVLVNRLKAIMPLCIAENQSAFVPGRLITDNILVAHELLHYLNGSKNGPNKGAAIKLDMEKAYDRVEWQFLIDVLSKMGFASSWIDLLMNCVTTVSYAVRVNGCISEFFRPTRGLRQGDPLSPYLFLFCTQGLSALLLKEQAEKRIIGVRASQRGPRINHLLYADDCILFIKNSVEEASRMKEVLRLYESSSGQRVNVEKSAIFFSKGTSQASKDRIQEVLQMREEADLGNYLGLPLLVGKNKINILGFINGRVDKRVLGWTKNLLSFGGRETLIKSVAQALPAYAMQAFLLPECILDPIVSTMRRFWWSGKARERGWAHVAWGKLCRPKSEGGLGFRNLKQFNIALLGKQVWKLYTCRDSLCFKVMSAKYFPDGNIMNAGPKDKCSFVWRSILKAKEELKAGFHWRIGIDSEVALFQQQWGGDKPIILEGNHLDNHNNPVKCKEFMIPGLAKWDERKVQQVFSSNDAQKILSCPIANTREDILRWSHHHSGLFVTKTAHHWLEKQGWVSHVVSPVWKILSKANVLPKVRIFGWRVAQEALPVGKKLQAACVGPGLCQLCGKDIETVLHALRECPSTQEVLQVSGLERLLPQGPFSTGLQWLEEATQVLDTQQFTFMLVLLWNIWNKRNRWVHQNQLIPPKLVADFAQMLIGEALDSHNGLPTLSADSAVTKWLKPELGSIKVNVDGAWLERGNLAAIGVVARDHNGLLIDARARRLEGSYTPEIVEAYAMAEGFRMAIENGWQNVTFEGDSTGIISKMHADCMDRSVASTYLSEAWKTLKDRADFAIRHVGRECNQAAHQLAHWGLSCIDPFVFSWDTPNCIRDIVINDAIYG